MKNLFFILCLSITSIGNAFETTSGNYIGQQDAIQLLSDIFYGEARPSNSYDLSGCVSYREVMSSSSDKDLYELGFNNVESGERLVQSPDAAYVLYFDSCISKIVKQIFNYYTEVAGKRVLTETGYMEIEKWRAAYFQANANAQQISYFYGVNRELFTQVDAKVFPVDLREKLVDAIFLKVFGSTNLIPKDYRDESKKDLISLSSTSAMKMEDFIVGAYKKAIVNDYLLKY